MTMSHMESNLANGVRVPGIILKRVSFDNIMGLWNSWLHDYLINIW